MGLFDKFQNVPKNGISHGDSKENYLDLVQKEPGNANAHMKLAEIYQKKGEKQKAISEYLLAADIFTEKESYRSAIAIYKQLHKQDPSLGHVHSKIAEIYREMGFLADALAEYKVLAQYYESLGMKDKVSEIKKVMSEMEPGEPASEGSFDSVIPLPKEEEGDPGLQKAITEGLYDLRAELATAKPLQMEAPKEVSTSGRVYGIEDIFKELKGTGKRSIVDPPFQLQDGHR
jgi:tetratricopeptide (TPR) repeat protein